MIDSKTIYRSFAVSGCILVIFIGLCHEVIGARLFPWAPALLGGPVGWHGLGILGMSVGLLMLGGTLRLIKVPVARLAILVAVVCTIISAYWAVGRGDFHFFATVGVLAAVSICICHRRAE